MMTGVGLRIRGMLSHGVFEFTAMDLATNETSASSVNLISQDNQRFVEFAFIGHRALCGPFIVLLGVIYIYSLVGPAVLAGVGLMIGFIPVAGRLQAP